VDLWHGGINVLRDAGTFSYNCEPSLQSYFSSTSAHNTIQFDGEEQMPKLSRFLLGRWPKITVEANWDSASPTVSAKCQDWRGCTHERQLASTEMGYRIIDRIEGYRQKAVLRWRLAPEWKWEIEGNRCYSAGAEIAVQAHSPSLELRIVPGWESLYYQERTPVQVLEGKTEVSPQTLVSEIRMK
jgi:hypothetical protein